MKIPTCPLCNTTLKRGDQRLRPPESIGSRRYVCPQCGVTIDQLKGAGDLRHSCRAWERVSSRGGPRVVRIDREGLHNPMATSKIKRKDIDKIPAVENPGRPGDYI